MSIVQYRISSGLVLLGAFWISLAQWSITQLEGDFFLPHPWTIQEMRLLLLYLSHLQELFRSEIRNFSSLIRVEMNKLRTDYKTEFESLHCTVSS